MHTLEGITPFRSNEQERVRAHTAPDENRRIDRAIEDRIRYYADQSREAITGRIEELDKEWSVERMLEAEASSMALVGLTLGMTVNRRFLLVPGFVAGMVLLHALHGWYPLLQVYRRLGFRTRQEIDREKYALRELRGDFADDSVGEELDFAAESVESTGEVGESSAESPDRVRRHTAPEINEWIDRESKARAYGTAARGSAEVGRRIDALEREWDMERLLQTNASVLSLAGLALASIHRRRWLLLPGAVFSFFLQHAVQGWCPPVPFFRRLGIRTRGEIDREKYALLALSRSARMTGEPEKDQ
jgi:hypothetical protein